ncbi:MAG: hypothetical protein Rubg2KO_16660 [Rubricoccaceae bacterium]
MLTPVFAFRVSCLLVLALALFGLLSGVASAQTTTTFEPLDGPEGGAAWSVLTGADGDVIVGTYDGFSSAFRSSDGGDTWSHMDALPSARYQAFARAPNGDLFAASSRSIERSTDDGQTWTSIQRTPGFQALTDVAITSDGTLFASSRVEGMVRSTDGGTTWTTPTTGLDTLYTWSMTIGSTGRIYAGSVGRLHTSDDNGDTWTSRHEGLPDAARIETILESSTGRAFITTNEGVFWRDASDSEWTEATEGLLTANKRYYALAQLDSGRIVASTAFTVYRSDDDGATWTEADAQARPSFAYSLSVAPNGDIIAPTFYRGVFRSTDGGVTWAATNDGFYNANVTALGFDGQGNLLAGTQAGAPDNLFRRDAEAGTWDVVDGGAAGAFQIYGIERVSTGVILMMSNSGVHRSTDNGVTWTRVAEFTQTTYSAVETATGDLLVGTFNQGIARSTDNGQTWTFVTSPPVRNRQLVRAPDGTLYGVLDNLSDRGTEAGVIRSTDNGLTWAYANDGFAIVPGRGQSLAVDLEGRVYASFVDSPGPWRTDDGGTTWTAVNAGLTSTAVRVITDVNNNVYAALRDGSIYVSADAGDTWTAVTTEPTGRYPSSLAFGPDRELYIGSYGRGVYRSVNAVSVAEDPTETALELVAFPNPVASSATIQFVLDEASDVQVSVFDVTGREVTPLAARPFPAGSHELTWLPDGLASGVYLVRLDADTASVTRRVVVAR